VIPARGIDVVTVVVRGDEGARGAVRVVGGGGRESGGDATFAILRGEAVARLGREGGADASAAPMDDAHLRVEVRLAGRVSSVPVPPARRVDEPVIVAGTDPGGLLEATAAAGLVLGHEPVFVPAGRLPREWPAYDGVAAVVTDAETAARLDAGVRAALTRYLARGGTLCVVGEPGPRCAHGASPPVPPEIDPRATSIVPAALLRWAAIIALAAALMTVAFIERMRLVCVAVPIALAVAPIAWSAPPEVRGRGVSITGGAGVADGARVEDQIVGRATVVAPLGGAPPLDEGSWWIRRDGAFMPLEASRWPGSGTWRVDAFVPAAAAEAAAWRAGFAVVRTSAVEPPW
jgi:hypothetical protein